VTPDPIALVAGLNQNFQLFRGEDKVLLVDMTGYDLATATALEWWLARSSYAEGEDILINKILGAGITVTDAKLEITLTSADTAALSPDIYYHELRLVQTAAVKVALTGNVLIRMSLNTEGVTP
jgi:hypothetical protein